MLDLRQLQTFYLVAITKSFAAAARQLGCAQPNVTTRVKALERELGAQLINRERFSRKITLTEVGHRTFEYAGPMLALAAEIKTVVHSMEWRETLTSL